MDKTAAFGAGVLAAMEKLARAPFTPAALAAHLRDFGRLPRTVTPSPGQLRKARLIMSRARRRALVPKTMAPPKPTASGMFRQMRMKRLGLLPPGLPLSPVGLPATGASAALRPAAMRPSATGLQTVAGRAPGR